MTDLGTERLDGTGRVDGTPVDGTSDGLPEASGGARPTDPRPGDGPGRRLPRPRVRAGDLAFAIAGLPLAVLCGGYVLAALYAGTLLSPTLLGLPLLAGALRGARVLAGPHRRLVSRLLGEPVTAPAAPAPAGGLIPWVQSSLTDPVGWRAMLYLGLRLPVGVLTLAAATAQPLLGLWAAGFPLWHRLLEPADPVPVALTAAGMLLGTALLALTPTAIRATAALNRFLARRLLGPAGTETRVAALEKARSTLLADNTEHLRRLERDLHDGTQAELVAIAITLSLADDALTAGTEPPASAPASAAASAAASVPEAERLRTLLVRARRQTDDAIAGLRRLTRGIHPVALDSGLGAALPALTAAAGVPVRTGLDLRHRPDPAIERAVYFCLAELLTNIAKHSDAREAAVDLTADRRRVRLTVRDDGRGGATAGPGGGLAGLRERLAAVDGTLHIDSPPGGPTTVTATLPATI
ncbi:sensor histidine kinase [Kitasatospora camelliae]|uniref:histidine kinase n=1 Tax=Kitasatospora camelliae TaxID=3156397 RepID=A0AAU8K4T9_9ACTN